MAEQVTSLTRLIELSKERRSVTISDNWSLHMKCKPAAFVINLPGVIIQRMIDSGMYVYEKKG